MYVTPVDIDEEKVEIMKNIRPFKVFLACLLMWWEDLIYISPHIPPKVMHASGQQHEWSDFELAGKATWNVQAFLWITTL